MRMDKGGLRQQRVVANDEAREGDLNVYDVDIREQLGERKPKIGTRPHTPH